jgi:hypothetical protein
MAYGYTWKFNLNYKRNLIVKGIIKNQHNDTQISNLQQLLRNSVQRIENLSRNITPRGMIIIWHPSTNNIPKGWALCDGKNGTPDLRNRFIVGTEVDNKQGPVNTINPNGIVKLHPNNIPPHSHSAVIHNKDINHQHTGVTAHAGNHNHGISTRQDDWNDSGGHGPSC